MIMTKAEITSHKPGNNGPYDAFFGVMRAVMRRQFSRHTVTVKYLTPSHSLDYNRI